MRRGLAPAVHAVVALVVTWPFVLHLGGSIPQGTEPSGTVPLFNLWTLAWTADRVPHLFAGWWDAPIFWPTRGTFALSDPQALTGTALAPVAGLASPTWAYGLGLLVALTLTGIGAARVARRLGADAVPAVAVGVLAQALPFVLRELGVLQLVMVFPLVFALDALLAWADDGDRADAARLGLWSAAALLTSTYYGLFWLLTAPVLLFARADRSWWSRSRLASGAFALVGLLAAAVVLLPQAALTAGNEWSTTTIEANSAALVDWDRLDEGTLGTTAAPWLADEGGSGQRLYPGTVLLGLAAAGLVLGRRDGRRRTVTALAVGALVTALLSLGLRLDLAGWQPYATLQDLVPPLASLRSPFRFAALTQVLLVALAAPAVARLWSWRPRLGPALVLVATTLAVVEGAALPAELVEVPDPGATDWAQYLADQEGGAVAMVPWAPGPTATDFEPTVIAMLAALDHGHPLLNGYSGFFPARHDRLAAAVETFPDDEALAALEADGAEWLVLDRRFRPGTDDDALRAAGWTPVLAGEDRTVYRAPT